jgi:hypothetical protein
MLVSYRKGSYKVLVEKLWLWLPKYADGTLCGLGVETKRDGRTETGTYHGIKCQQNDGAAKDHGISMH